MRSMGFIWVGLVASLGCKDNVERLMPNVDLEAIHDAGDLGEGDVGAQVQSVDMFTWAGDFAPWEGRELSNSSQLPACPTGWFENPIDDEFVAWKCSNFKGMELGDVGQFTVHTRNGRVFMVTNAFDFDDPAKLQEALAALRKINSRRRIPLNAKYQRIAAELWDLNSYVTLLSAGKKGLSLVYLNSEEDVEIVYQVVQRQSKLSKAKKRYRLGALEIKLVRSKNTSFVGRGPERWDAKKAGTFVVIDYEVRNLSRGAVSQDGLKFTILGKNLKYSPNARAEHAFLTSDRTGRYRGALDYRKTRPRAHVFEVARDVVSRPMILVVSDADQKLIYRIDLR